MSSPFTGMSTSPGGAGRPGPPMRASFDSDDSCCGEGISEGEQIRADGYGGWEHMNCVRYAAASATSTCPRCTASHPGEC
jgi:hypothetical protein